MGKLFGTDGVRGLANVAPMDSETVMRLGRAAAYVLRQSKGSHRILIGKDTRVSGYMLETALASGIASMGVDVLICGPLPTPGVAFMTRSMRADAGVMISASHNPYEDNGIKFFGADGFKLADSTEADIERMMEPGHLDELRATPELIGKAYRIEDAIGRYTVFLKGCLEREIKFDGVKIVLDCANGAAYRVAPLVFGELGATLITTGDEPDGKNINAASGSLHPERLQELVAQHGANFGVAYDGDADRVVMVDEKGNLFDGDMLLAMMAVDFKKRGLLAKNGVVATVMSNFGLEVALREQGIELFRSDVGDRYVLGEMLARGVNLGGEQSGHLISLQHNTTGDGVMTSLLVAGMLMREGLPLSHYAKMIDRYPQILVNVPIRRKVPFVEVPEVVKVVGGVESRIKDTGRVLLRYSGTEAKARVMVECADASVCESSAQEIADVIRQVLA